MKDEAENNINEFLEEEGYGAAHVLNNENLNQEDEKLSVEFNKENLEVYKIIIDTRKFEIENFWKRSTFFWGTIAILFYAYFSSKIDVRLLSILSMTGFIYSLIFSLSIRGSKYWQEHWEILAAKYEKKLNNIRLFRWQLLKTIYDKEDLPLLKPRRISVSKLLMIASDFLTLSWLGLFAKDINYLIAIKDINLKLNADEPIHFSKFAAVVIGIFIFMGGYLLIFLIKTRKENNQYLDENKD